jgi:hypothetical protein
VALLIAQLEGARFYVRTPHRRDEQSTAASPGACVASPVLPAAASVPRLIS